MVDTGSKILAISKIIIGLRMYLFCFLHSMLCCVHSPSQRVASTLLKDLFIHYFYFLIVYYTLHQLLYEWTILCWLARLYALWFLPCAQRFSSLSFIMTVIILIIIIVAQKKKWNVHIFLCFPFFFFVFVLAKVFIFVPLLCLHFCYVSSSLIHL